MDGLKSAAMALALAMLAGQASAQAGAVVNLWPRAGAWVTVLTSRPGGGAACSAATGPQKTGAGEEEASFGFDVSEQETHFHLRLRGAPPMEPSSLMLEAAGAAPLDMPVIQRLDKDGVQDLVADLPGDRFVRLVEPRLVGKETIVIRAGDRTYVLPHEDFVRTIDNLSACAREAREPSALPSR
jgi:hypothetical protein